MYCIWLFWDVMYKKVKSSRFTGVSNKGCGGGSSTIPPPLAHTPFLNLSLFWQNVSVKVPEPMLSVNLEYFIIKNEIQNSLNIQSRRNQIFINDDSFERSYLRFAPTIRITTQKQSLSHSYLIQTFVNEINIKFWNDFRVIPPQIFR